MAQPKYVGDAKIRALLEAFSCPTPFHAIRAHLMGNIASLVVSASPMRAIESFWPDGLPPFESKEEANELIHGLLGLWNHLAGHQKRNKPFKLTAKPFGDDRDSMREFLEVRTEEIDQFLEGVQGGDEGQLLPDEIWEEIETLAENAGLMNATLETLGDVAATDQEISGLAKGLRELSKIAGVQINDIIMSCVRYRRSLVRPTLH